MDLDPCHSTAVLPEQLTNDMEFGRCRSTEALPLWLKHEDKWRALRAPLPLDPGSHVFPEIWAIAYIGRPTI